MTNIAVILAGGTGKRFGEGLPKQFRTLEDGRTVLQTCVDTFLACPSIHQIYVVMHPDWMEDSHLSPLKEKGIVFIPGGLERWQSSWNAIQFLANRFTDSPIRRFTEVNVLIHDAARPFVRTRIIEDVCHALETHEAVTVAIPATDTIYEIERPAGLIEDRTLPLIERRLKSIPDRATMMRAQTPQAFRLDVIKKAFDIALKSSPYGGELERGFTDDCGIVHTYLPDTPIYIVLGEEANRKITFPDDLQSPACF